MIPGGVGSPALPPRPTTVPRLCDCWRNPDTSCALCGGDGERKTQ